MSGLAEILEENQRLRAALQTEREARSVAEEKLAAVTEKAEHLAQTLALLALKESGPKSERFIADGQEPLPFAANRPPPRPPVPAPELDEKPAKPKRKPKRRRLDELELPKRQVRCHVEDGSACMRCGGELRVFGEATSHRIDWVPGHFEVHEVVREKCSCPACPGEGVLAAPTPYFLPRASCGNGLLARVLVNKFGDHLPLNRQSTRMKREGFEVATSTMSGWVAQAADSLGILAAAMRARTLDSDVLQGDDTGLPVQDGDGGRTRKGRLWVFTNQAFAWYGFSATKQGEHPVELLRDFRGDTLLLDGGSEFNEAVRTLGLKRAGCWSHLRRYFFEARLYHPTESRLAVTTVRDLFMLERAHRTLSSEERGTARQQQSKPIVDSFFDWVRELSTIARPGSKLGEAVTYARNQESRMRLFLDQPELPLHNNLSELMLRQPIVGRKNWLFAGSQGGAKAACTLYTVIASCMLQGVDPHAYLLDVFGRLPDHPVNRLGELLPDQWVPS